MKVIHIWHEEADRGHPPSLPETSQRAGESLLGHDADGEPGAATFAFGGFGGFFQNHAGARARDRRRQAFQQAKEQERFVRGFASARASRSGPIGKGEVRLRSEKSRN